VDKDLDGKMDYSLWSGSLRESGRYYIVVEHARDLMEPAYYRFTISGENLSFPLLGETPMASSAPLAEAQAMATEQGSAVTPEMDLTGTGPDFAMAPSFDWKELQSGEYHWYSFTYDEHEDWNEPVTIHLFSEPGSGAVLTVRNGDQAELWRQEGEHDHFGCCVPEEMTVRVEEDDLDEDRWDEETEESAYAVWSADLTESGVYYIVVEHAKNSSEPAFYRFELSGDGLHF